MSTQFYISSLSPFHQTLLWSICLHVFWEDILETVFHHSAEAYLGLCLWIASKELYPRDLISHH